MSTTEVITEPKKKGCAKYIVFFVLFFVLFGGIYVWYNYYFVFGEGVKSGNLNYVVKKGNIFKTYEGKIIQEGFGKGKITGQLNSYEFEFSIEDQAIFNQMESNSGKQFDLHYKEYKSALPWRGNSAYVVDKIVAIK